MLNVAILGFGVVGSGVASLITNNYECVSTLGADAVNIKYILDLRDFPDSPFADRVVHDYNIILNDPEVKTVIEVMGGSHPAYEFTVSALRAGKNVITSNKEVVANFGDEFLKVAREFGVSYRFEAAVGGGIPVIAPMISQLLQNKPLEVRGILNGTTNYILTKMFTYGESFASALADAQTRGYAERNPDADVLGYDAARKIAILAAIATGKLVPVDTVYTEGITSVRQQDVKAAECIGCSIKLVGRCIVNEGAPTVMVCPFLVSDTELLSGVKGVYNAVEFIGEPLGNVMFYGQGAGAGATASAVVGDLMLVMRSGTSTATPVFEKVASAADFDSFTCRRYVAVGLTDKSAALEAFGDVEIISEQGEFAFVTNSISESKYREKSASLSVVSHIRIM